MRRRRATALLVLAACAGLVLLVVLIGGSSSRRAPARHAPRTGAAGEAQQAPPRVTVTRAGELPSARQDAAMAPYASGGDVLLIGGLDSEEASLTEVLHVSGESATEAGALPTPTHDACAGEVGGSVYLFGGGEQSSFSAILRISASGTAEQVSSLPTPASDVACVTVRTTVYVIGGYTGQQPLRTILAWQPGLPPRVIGELPKPLRYAAAGAVGGRLLIAGGTSGVEASREVYSFDPASGKVLAIGQLPYAVTHAAGVALGGSLLVLGGRGEQEGTQHSKILAVSPGGAVTIAGELPEGLSDTAATAVGGGALLAGGVDRRGQLHSGLLRIAVAG